MRIQLQEQEDGRWTIWIGEWPEGEKLVGEWGGTYPTRAAVMRVRQLLRVAYSAKLAEVRRRRRVLKSSN